jgi:hypothetical protein
LQVIPCLWVLLVLLHLIQLLIILSLTPLLLLPKLGVLQRCCQQRPQLAVILEGSQGSLVELQLLQQLLQMQLFHTISGILISFLFLLLLTHYACIARLPCLLLCLLCVRLPLLAASATAAGLPLQHRTIWLLLLLQLPLAMNA